VDAPKDTANTTQIDQQADFEGKLTGKDARILGRFRGEIQLSGRLTWATRRRSKPRSRPTWPRSVASSRARSACALLVLLEKARVEGSIDAQVLAVREGAQVNATVNAGQNTGAARATGS